MSYDLRSFRRFAPLLKLEGMQPLALEKFQNDILRDHFGLAIELLVLIPKKNYKTTTLAALALSHVHEVADAEVPILASTEKQAGVMYRQAEKMIRRSGEKDGRRKDVYHLGGFTYEVRPGYREIRCVETRGLIKVLPAEAGAVDGIIPTLALVDELHRHPNGELYGVLSDGLGARHGRMVTISTAGADEGAFLGQMRESFRDIGGVKRGRHLRAQDGSDVYHEWALDPEDDPENFRHVKRANPAKGLTLAELQRRRRSKGMTMGRWLRFACGIWTAGEEPEIQAKEWDPLRVDIGRLTEGDPVWLAPSAGDNAAIGIASPRPDERVAVGAVVLERQEGHSLLVDVERVCLELAERYDVIGVLDPGRAFERSGDILEAAGLPRIEAVWSPQRKMAATGTFLRMLRDGALMHDGDQTLRSHVLKVTLRASAGEEYMDVNAYDRAAVAVAMAVHHAAANSPEPYVGSPVVMV
jgi:phage terminase large subunit-like protein